MSASTPLISAQGFHRHLNGSTNNGIHTANGSSNGLPTNGSNGIPSNGSVNANGGSLNGGTNGMAANGVTATNGVNGTGASGVGFGPDDVGIINMEIYFPSTYVDQTELELYDKEATGANTVGKYTKGLGQTKMGFCTDAEDINSLCLTVVSRLVKKSGISYSDIGRLEVGTETLVDKSKSVKTTLMQLFAGSGNTDVLAVDNTNACYGGTAALFNCIDWVNSNYDGDGRYAIAVCGDIAVYAKGNARPTGGAGAVAMLIGRNPAMVLDRGLRATHVENVYDFYKPDMASEYPVVDGKLSITSYLQALDKCYLGYRQKALRLASAVDLSFFDALLFHSPFCRLVQKSLARLRLNDFVTTPKDERLTRFPKVDPRFVDVQLENTYGDRDVERAFLEESQDIYEAKTKPSLHVATNVGNMYTPSLYGGLVSYICSLSTEELAGKRAALFSYGSGLVATLFSLKFSGDCSPGSPLASLRLSLADVPARLESRTKVTPADFEAAMQLREDTYHAAPYTPQSDKSLLFPGTYYLAAVDDRHRRSYRQVAEGPAAEQNGRH